VLRSGVVFAGLTEDHVGKVVPLKFLEVDQAKNRLVVSNRRAMVETKLTNLEPGQLVQVTTISNNPPTTRLH
jgi:small subunit ribosomal protein S1